MKFGLLVYENTDNIGDDIQSFAALNFLPQVDYLIDREKMDLFVPDSEERVAVVMNGWYMHNRYNWPPSPFIYPLLISMHITQCSDYLSIGTKFLEGMGGEFLKTFGPVGCRDESTLKIMKELNIPGYLSACLTLTIPRVIDVLEEDKKEIYLVDIDSNTEIIIRKKYVNECFTSISHSVDYQNKVLTWNERVQIVKDLLAKYQRAKCVITTRLHCALPCLALGVPVLLIADKQNNDRFSNFLPLLHYCTPEEMVEGTLKYNISSPEENKPDFLVIRENLIKVCKQFICNVKNIQNDNLPNISVYRDYWLKKAQWQKTLIMNSVNGYQKVIDELRNYLNDLKSAKDWIEGQWKNTKKDLIEKEKYLEQVLEGKTWIEEQWKNTKKDLIEKEKYLEQVLEGKTWIEEQWNEKNEEIKQIKKREEELLKLCDSNIKAISEKDKKIEELRSFKGWIKCFLKKKRGK